MRSPRAPSRIDPLGRCVGPHLLVEHIGEGGICNIYRGRHLRDGTEHAIKLLRSSRRWNRDLIDRMRFEARIGIRLCHPNLVRVVGEGESDFGPYLAMELLDGQTLAERLRGEARLSPIVAADIVRQAAEGLAAVHHVGLIHGDVKPSNLMLTRSNGCPGMTLKILDFGIARQSRIRQDTRAREARLIDQIIGTPGYLAPEQLEHGAVGTKIDLYALGVVLYRMISGHAPFEGTFEEVFEKQMTEFPPALPLARGLGPLALRLLARHPRDRPTAVEVGEVIEGLFRS